jgi:hypothetical protein
MDHQDAALGDTLSELSKCHDEALLARSTGLEAANRFYGEVLTYQWHIDAVDVQLGLLEEVTAYDTESPTSGTTAMDRCLIALEQQKTNAIACLCERASVYEASRSSHRFSGTTESPAEKHMVENNSHGQQRLEQHVKLAQFTFSQITEETLAYKDLLPMSSQHVHLYSALWRRREFWVKQLEETWTEWNMATERMHKADSDAAEMWLYLVDLSMKALHVEPLEAEAALVEGLAKVAARAFIAEFLQLGSQNDFLSSVLGFLLDADALHMVARNFLDTQLTISALPASHVSLAIAAANEDDSVDDWRDRYDYQCTIWLADCLVESMSEAAHTGDEVTVRSLANLCDALGGAALTSAVCDAISRSGGRTGKNSTQLALAQGHTAIVDLLQEKISRTSSLQEHLPSSTGCCRDESPKRSPSPFKGKPSCMEDRPSFMEDRDYLCSH